MPIPQCCVVDFTNDWSINRSSLLCPSSQAVNFLRTCALKSYSWLGGGQCAWLRNMLLVFDGTKRLPCVCQENGPLNSTFDALFSVRQWYQIEKCTLKGLQFINKYSSRDWIRISLLKSHLLKKIVLLFGFLVKLCDIGVMCKNYLMTLSLFARNTIEKCTRKCALAWIRRHMFLIFLWLQTCDFCVNVLKLIFFTSRQRKLAFFFFIFSSVGPGRTEARRFCARI